MIIRHITLFFCFFSFSACTIHPEYTKPTIDTANAWQAKLPHGGDVETLTNWWSQFNDASLSKLITEAQNKSPTLAQAIASIQAARATQQSNNGKRLPTVDGNARFSKSKSGNAGGSGNIESTSTSLDARWEIDLFGGLAFGRQAADARVASAQYQWHQARVSLAAEVASEYVQYRACKLTVAALHSALVSKEETARITQISANAGFTAPADALLSKASANASNSVLIGQQAQCELTVKTLVALTSLPETNLLSMLAETTTFPSPQVFSIDQLPADLIRQRPDLMADERQLAAASADVGIATADLYPSISLNGSIGYQKTTFNGLNFNTNTWSFGPTLSLPVFNGGQGKAQVKLMEANFNLALSTYKADVLNAIKEVEQALVKLNSASKRVEIEQVSHVQYADYFKAAEHNWHAGGLDLLALEDARRLMINAQTSLITQKQNHVLQWIALYKAFGGDWRSVSDAHLSSIDK